MDHNFRTPNHEGVLYAVSSITGKAEYITSTNHVLDTVGGGGGGGDVNLTQVGGSPITLGQKPMATSLPVTIASDQSALAVSQSGTWNINNVSGTISLPTGAATSALQTTGNTSLATIAGAVSGTEMQVDIVSSATISIDGTIASGTADSGNPVKIGGRYNSTLPTFTTGQRGDVQLGSRGSVNTTLFIQDSTTSIAVASTNADGVAAGAVASRFEVASREYYFNGTTWDRARGVSNGTNSTGTGIAAAGLLAQFDDTSPTTITENQFGNVRMSSNRNMYTTIRDAAGNERGVNVDASNRMQTTLPPLAATIDSVAAGTQTSAVYNGNTALIPKFAVVNASASGDNTIVAAVATRKIRVLAVQLTFDGTVQAKWQSGAGGTDLTGLIYAIANAGNEWLPYVLPYNPLGWFETAASALLNLNLNAAVPASGSITYVEV